MFFLIKLKRIMASLFRWHPDDPSVAKILDLVNSDLKLGKDASRKDSYLVAVQCPHDPLYFGLFAAIVSDLRTKHMIDGRLLLISSISGAIGVGWKQTLLRSLPVRWVLCSQWARANKKIIGKIGYRSVSLSHPRGDFLDWVHARKIWELMKTCNNISELSVDGIVIGDLVIDSYLRFRPSPEFKIADPFVKYIIWQTLRDLRRASQFFESRKPKLYLSSYSTYVEHGVAIRVALKNGVPVRVYGNLTAFGKKLSKNDFYHTANTSDYRQKFEELENQEEAIILAEKALSFRLAGGVDLATSYMKESAYTQTDEYVPDVSESVVVFLHDFYDSPHVYHDLIFRDFWEWARFTIDTLSASKTKFFIKPHPNQIALSDTAFSELLNVYPDILVISPQVTNKQLVEAGIKCGVTAYGTVAHELAFLGVPSIGCARHPHHSFGFCTTANSIDEYKSLLESAGASDLPKSKLREQALQFFYMHNLFGKPSDLLMRELFAKYCRSFDIKDSASMCLYMSDLRQSHGWREHIEEIGNELESKR